MSVVLYIVAAVIYFVVMQRLAYICIAWNSHRFIGSLICALIDTVIIVLTVFLSGFNPVLITIAAFAFLITLWRAIAGS